MAITTIERKLAWAYLRPVRREGFVSVVTAFSVIGIMLGVATLILVTSLMNGIRGEMTARFIGLGGHISVYHRDGRIAGDDPVLQTVRAVEGVKAAVPKITGQVMATHEGAGQGAQVMAIPADALRRGDMPDITQALKTSQLTSLTAGEGVILGDRLAESLRLEQGEAITLISPQGRATIAGMVPRVKAYPVVGTLSLGMHLYDSSLVLMPYEQAQVFFRYDNAFQRLDVMLTEDRQTAAVTQQLQRQLGGDLAVENWQRKNASLFQALTIQRNVMVVILALIVLVAAFNIISSLIMLVQDKGADIAILRTLGATRKTIMTVFCLSGTWIGLIGTALGLVLGLLAAANLERVRQAVEAVTGQEVLVEDIYFLSTLPTQTDPAEVAVIVMLAIGLSFLATLYPAWRAASLNPSEALRYE